jgi:hypothetical protein
MFIELPAYVTKDEEPYNRMVNVQRIMWADPMQEGDEDFTRLYMNVAGNNGEPAQLDIALTYDKVKALLPTTSADEGTEDEKSD